MTDAQTPGDTPGDHITTLADTPVEVIASRRVPPRLALAGRSSGDLAGVQAGGLWLEGLVVEDSRLLASWREDATTRYFARVWHDGHWWTCPMVIATAQPTVLPGIVRIQAQSQGRVRPADA